MSVKTTSLKYEMKKHLVQRFIPDTCRETCNLPPLLSHLLFNLFIHPHQLFLSLIIPLPLWILLIYQIHLVYQTPHPSIWRVLAQGEEDFLEIRNIGFPFGSGIIEYVDEDGDV